MANKNIFISLILIFIVFAVVGVGFTQVSDSFIDKCVGEINLSINQNTDSFVVFYDEQLPSNNYTITLQDELLELWYPYEKNGVTYNITAGYAYRNCYTDRTTRTLASGSCIYNVKFSQKNQMERQYTSIKELKKAIENTYNTNLSIKGKQKQLNCMVMGQ